MRPEAPGGGGEAAPPPGLAWQPGIPSVREHLPSLVFGAAVPIGIYFLVRPHVGTDTTALIAAGGFSVAWILLQGIRRRKVDLVGAVVLFGFTVSVVSSILLGGNAYVLKVRDGFFTALFGVACIVTLFTHDRPALFYVGRYLSAGIGLVVEASCRLTLADILPTAAFLAVSPFITASAIGGLFAFTALYSRRVQLEAGALGPRLAPRPAAETDGSPEIPLP
jgi:hypothetical protein